MGGEGSLRCRGLPGPPSLSACSRRNGRGKSVRRERACVFVRDSACARPHVSACACVSGCARKDCVLFLCPINPHGLLLCSRVQVLCVHGLCTGVRACACPCVYSLHVCVFVRAGNERTTPFTQALEVLRVKSQAAESSEPKPNSSPPTPIPILHPLFHLPPRGCIGTRQRQTLKIKTAADFPLPLQDLSKQLGSLKW